MFRLFNVVKGPKEISTTCAYILRKKDCVEDCRRIEKIVRPIFTRASALRESAAQYNPRPLRNTISIYISILRVRPTDIMIITPNVDRLTISVYDPKNVQNSTRWNLRCRRFRPIFERKVRHNYYVRTQYGIISP